MGGGGIKGHVLMPQGPGDDGFGQRRNPSVGCPSRSFHACHFIPWTTILAGTLEDFSSGFVRMVGCGVKGHVLMPQGPGDDG